MTKIAIIGAGISGLSAANLLKDHAQVAVFEKARGVGGRMSTRYAEPYYFDHGAQYFTARTTSFQNFIQPMIDDGIIERWNPRYAKLDNHHIIDRRDWGVEEPRYVGAPRMNQVTKRLAKGINVHINTKIISIQNHNKWHLTDENGSQHTDFDWVICTAPSPQATALLPKYFIHYDAIKACSMQACIALMLGFKESIAVNFEAAHVINSDISWIAINSHKPKRADAFTMVAHSSSEYAQAHIDANQNTITQYLIDQTSQILKFDANIADFKTAHIWRYANKTNINPISSVYVDEVHQLAVCGDWCQGGRIESGFISAYNLVEEMKKRIL